MTVRELINELLFYDPSLKIAFLNHRKNRANEDLSFVEISRYSEEFISFMLEGEEKEDVNEDKHKR